MTDTSKTRDQLIERALKEIGALLPGEAAAAEDYATLDDLIDPLFEQLSSDTIYTVNDADAIELDAFLPLSRLLANMAGPEFGAPINDQAKARDEGILRRISSSKPTYLPLKTDYF